eukprot:TRINITY_DN61732_c0_g1_i1.p1 TRINITY_DN61732_c0_g1~~TRINITY_DN61732_c0_g1_i1.p1  ORF type:complete len:123 (+),score=13.59 TRINITY_DN61732_c0_g1_i1:158-526(+)
MGPRKNVPTQLEIERVQEMAPVPLKIHLLDGTYKSITVDSYTLVSDVEELLVQKCELQAAPFLFALYEAPKDSLNYERILDPNIRILDVMGSWENPPVIHELQIGRAVQQECRDRSRMPSSA